MRALNGTERGSWFDASTLMPLAAGLVVAMVAAAMMTWLKPVWLVFAVGGVLVMVGAFVVKEPITYWLALFLMALPLNIKKNFVSSEKVYDLVDTYGLTWGSNTLMLYVSDLAFAVLMVLWIRRRLRTDEPLRFPKLALVPLGFLIWSTVGALFSPYPTLTWFELLREYKFFFIFLFAVDNVKPRKMATIILATLFFGLLMQAGVTTYNYTRQSSSAFFGDTFGDDSTRYVPNTTVVAGEEDRVRGEGTFGHPNVTSQHAELISPFALLLLLMGRTALQRLTGLTFFLLAVLTIYLTFSRGGMVAFLTAIVVSLVVAWWRGLISRRTIWTIVCLALLASPYVGWKLHGHLTTRPEAFTERFAHWNVGLELASLNPVLGTGLNTSTALKRLFERRIAGPQIEEDNIPIHNHYLIALIEIGVIGTALYCGFFLLVAVRAFQASATQELLPAVLSIGILSVLVGTAVHMTIDLFSADGLHTLMWFYAGIILALEKENRSNGLAPAAPAAAGPHVERT